MKHAVPSGAHRAIAALIAAAGFAPAPARAEPNRMPQGGGAIYPAWTAQYWDNERLEGAPRWTQSQIRVRFDWEDWRPVIGSLGESVRDFPTDRFSARFAATLIARFDETYTFTLVSDEGARLRIRPEGAKDWTTLIDAWAPHARRADTARMALKPSVKYEVELDYYDLTGDAGCALRWSSPSTPEEVVDYVSGNTIREHAPDMWADMNAFSGTARDGAFPANSAKSGDFEVDANGWPKGDFKYTLQQGYRTYVGRHRVSFRGLAEVRMGGPFTAGGQTHTNVLPSGAGYDAKANRTTAFLDVDDASRSLAVGMSQTQRAPDSPKGSGVTEFHVMKPVEAGGTVAHEVGEMSCGEARKAFLPFICFRVQRTGLNDIVKWSERTRPAYARIGGQFWRADVAYEKLVAEANEIGRDLYLCFGGSIDYEFMENLAKLTRYGSDGENPYDRPVKDPKYPPLNSNLRLYVEHGNEMGWSAIQPSDWKKDYDGIFKARKEPEWSALNFDGLVADDAFRGLMRYHAYRTVRMSQAMRRAWGDAAMGETVRVCLFGQYERDFQNTMCQYIDDYFNNGTGPHVKDPHPVGYYLWGAGPAVYYGTSDLWAESDKSALRDVSFEGYDLKPGEAALAPAGGAWTFEGGAGVVDVRLPRHEAVARVQPGAVVKLTGEAAAGFRFTVGPKDLYVYELGRRVDEGARDKGSVYLLNADGGPLGRASVTVDLKGRKPGETAYEPLRYAGWMTGDSYRVGLYRLEAGKTYLLVGTMDKGAALSGPDSRIEAGPGLTIDGAVRADGAPEKKAGFEGRIQDAGGPGTGFAHVNMRYTAAALAPAKGMVVVPPDPTVDPAIAAGGLDKGRQQIPRDVRTGTRMAFLAGKGAISQTVNVEAEGDYMLILTGAGGHTGDNRFDVTIGGTKVWDNELLSGDRKPKFGVYNYGTRYAHLKPGPCTVRIESRSDDPAAVAYFDGARLANLLDYFGGPNADYFLGAGQATGQTESKFSAVTKLTTAMAQNWGLVPFAYEGGFNAGGDWNGGNVFYAFQSKWDHPLSTVADNNWARFWHKHGGYNAMYYYPAFDTLELASTRRPWMAARDRAMGWELEPTEGLPIPGALTCADPHYQGQPGSRWDGWYHPFQRDGSIKATKVEKGQWKSWIVLAPAAGEYAFAAETGAGGKASLSVADAGPVASGDSGAPLAGRIRLTKGVHAVKIRCDDGAFDVTAIRVTR